MLIINLLLSFICAAVISWIFLHYLLSSVIHLGLIAPPNPDVPTHSKPVPLIGGLAICITVLPCCIVLSLIFNILNEFFWTGLGAVILLGLYKDKFQSPLNSIFQLIVQIIAILMLYESVSFYKAHENTYSEIPLFVLVSIVIFNGINFIDVIDGLAGSTLLIISAALGITALINGNLSIAFMLCVLTGSLTAFLYFNLHPARIFMGDMGVFAISYILLFATAFLLRDNYKIQPTYIIFIFIVPITEFVFTISRRLILHKTPYIGDANHLSLIMLNKGFRSNLIVIMSVILSILTMSVVVVLSYFN